MLFKYHNNLIWILNKFDNIVHKNVHKNNFYIDAVGEKKEGLIYTLNICVKWKHENYLKNQMLTQEYATIRHAQQI